MNELDLFDEMLRLGWTAVSACGYTHPTGWSIGVYRTRDHRVTLRGMGKTFTTSTKARSLRRTPRGNYGRRVTPRLFDRAQRTLFLFRRIPTALP